MYQEFYNLISNTIYNGSLTGDQTLVCTFISTIAVLTVIALPFYLVYRIIHVISGGNI